MSQMPPAISSTGEDNPELMYKGLGHVVRALHDALTWVGADEILAEASNEFPSARERLNHVAVLTEKAANTVLSTVENTLPLQQATKKNADKLLSQWDQTSLQDLSKEELLALAENTRAFIGETKNTSEMTEKALSDIMMAQDFQDLTGQLIKKVVSLLERTEKDLLGLLISGAPDGAISSKKKDDLLAGPGAVGGVQLNQESVDDLLSDLGF
ncbi:protein phosphatase CheZ [Undibacterium seohonense]|jgi:chemotaxis protein CheZ|uniref:Protein phosphatase CheZ n=1 Tax=Undibacterium seohonense TaxID=1344950 RepID=A0ABR6WZG3_9BURK|nr:protein phosphatase CheZ [Undibacterium seohonense]MBC3806016.1 protein phosphatase CheZ [Undibacterium seohonense]